MATPAAPAPRDHPELGADPLAAVIARAYQSERLFYRSINADDAEFFTRLRSEPGVALYSAAGWPRPFKRSQGDEIVKFSDGCLLAVIIEIDATKEPLPQAREAAEPASASGSATTTTATETLPKRVAIGSMTLRACFSQEITQSRSAELAINFFPDFHGRGYGSEATRWLLDWAFTMAGLHYVRLGTFSYNTRGIRAYEAVGFKRKGVEQEALWLAGKHWDFITYGLLDREWAQIKEARKGK